MRYVAPVGRERLFFDGAVVDCYILPPFALRKRYEAASMPHPVHFVRLVLDTGADLSVIDENALAILKLKPHREFEVTGISQKSERHLGYRLTLAVTQTGVERVETQVEVAAGRKPGQFDGVLGRDFLLNCRLIYDGHGGNFELEFVS